MSLHIRVSFRLTNMSTREFNLDDHDSSQLQMMDEMCLLVDSEDRVIGSETKLNCHRNGGSRHRAFSVLIFDSEGRILVQKRASEKITFPGVWAGCLLLFILSIGYYLTPALVGGQDGQLI